MQASIREPLRMTGDREWDPLLKLQLEAVESRLKSQKILEGALYLIAIPFYHTMAAQKLYAKLMQPIPSIRFDTVQQSVTVYLRY